MSTIRIVVYGSPAPQGSKKFVGMHGGHGMMVESSKKVKPWRQDVKAAAEQWREGQKRHALQPLASPLDGPLDVTMTFTLPKPTSAPKTRQTWPCRKPDVSKLVRSTEDALTDAGLWTDDARIVDLHAAKRFPGEGDDALDRPGAVIVVRSLTPVAPQQPELEVMRPINTLADVIVDADDPRLSA